MRLLRGPAGSHLGTVRDRLYVHVAWTTRLRSPIIDAGIAQFLQRFLASIAQQERARVLAFGVVRSHLHMLIRLHPTTNIPRLIQRMKGGSAAIANKQGHTAQEELKWAKGYNIESVSPRAIDIVCRYIDDQAEHHPDEAIPGWPPPVA